MHAAPWLQVTVEFPDPTQAEDIALTHVAPLLTEAEASGLIDAWFFIRKAPSWRVRYRPNPNTPEAREHILGRLNLLAAQARIKRATDVVYEPEARAFGGGQAMVVAHRLWHADSRHVLDHLAATAPDPSRQRRRELSILLNSAMLRAGGLDWYEQGDVWARVADHRDPPDNLDPDSGAALQEALRRLMSVELTSLTGSGAALAGTSDWVNAFTDAGRELARLAATGVLRRGLREVLAQHVIFAMNRLGLPGATQAVLVTTAATVVFGPDPTPQPPSRQADGWRFSEITTSSSAGRGAHNR